ncbi:MAG TPA: 5-oxoprolinase subunit PxpB [Puia sp.]
MESSHAIFPLGDAAITIDLGNHIDEQLNRKALAIQDGLAALHLPGVKDIIVAYSSVSVFYDPVSVITDGGPACHDGAFACMKKRLEAIWQEISASGFQGDKPRGSTNGFHTEGNIIRIPVCYEPEYGPDLDLLVRKKGLIREDIIRLHTSGAYRVYMIGFLPGFPYLGKVDPALEISRKERPVPVAAGGVGIAGNQTGIYPLNSPGGWQIIGRTPLKLFDPRALVPVRMKIGDWVQFFSVTQQEFRDLSTRGA